MTLVRRFNQYKRALQLVIFVNVFFMAWGLVAFRDYFWNRDPASLPLVYVGFGTLIFGLILPSYLLSRIHRQMMAMRQDAELMVARWVSGWLENYRQLNGETAFQSPEFWVNTSLLFLEVFGEKSKHPSGALLAEFAPIIRHEILRRMASSPHRPSPIKKSKRDAA